MRAINPVSTRNREDGVEAKFVCQRVEITRPNLLTKEQRAQRRRGRLKMTCIVMDAWRRGRPVNTSLGSYPNGGVIPVGSRLDSRWGRRRRRQLTGRAIKFQRAECNAASVLA